MDVSRNLYCFQSIYCNIYSCSVCYLVGRISVAIRFVASQHAVCVHVCVHACVRALACEVLVESEESHEETRYCTGDASPCLTAP